MRTTTEQEMDGLYRSWKDSGITRAEFAKENGLVLSTFYYCTKKFRRLDVATPGRAPLRGSVILPGLPWSFSAARTPS